MENRFSLLIQGRANSRIIKPGGQPGYFRSLYVEPSHRRKGYGLELMKFAIQYTGEFLEMDIRRQSKVAQRNAARLGYRKIGPSERFIECELWRHPDPRSELPRSRLHLLKRVRYRRADGRTDVLYLSNSLDQVKRP